MAQWPSGSNGPMLRSCQAANLYEDARSIAIIVPIHSLSAATAPEKGKQCQPSTCGCFPFGTLKKLSYSLDSWFTSSLLAYSKFQCCSSHLNCRSPLNRWFHPQLLLGYGLYPHHPMSISFHQWIRGSSCPKSTSLITQPWGRVISPFHFLRSSNIITLTSQWQAQWSQHTLYHFVVLEAQDQWLDDHHNSI